MASTMSIKTAKLPTAERRRLAESFLATAQWKLLDSRGTSSASGESVRVNMRIFVKGCPHNALREVHELLSSQREVIDPVVDGVVLPGTWHHRTAIWTKDERTGESGMATYTLIRFFTDGPITESNVVEDGCGSRTTVRFVWEAQAVEDLSTIVNPTTRDPYSDDMQGFSVKIGGVSRDNETNTFSYYVTVTERLTQEVPEYVSSADMFTVSRSRTVLGIRGGTDNPVDSDGDAVTIPDPLPLIAGELIDVNWSRNTEDCTLDASVKKRTANKSVLAGMSCAADLFSERDADSFSAAPAALSTHVPVAAGGIKWQHTSKRRPDGLWDTDKVKDTEKPVVEASKEDAVSLYRRTARTTDRSQSAAPAAASVSGGTRRTVSTSKTGGGLKDNTVAVETALPVSSARVAKSADVFGTSTSVTDRNQSGVPPDPVAGNGVTQEISTERTDDDVRDNATVTKVENTVDSAASASSRTLFNRSSRVTNKSSRAAVPVPSVGGGVGVAVSADTTPGGLKDVTVSTDEEVLVDEAKKSTRKTIFQDETTVVTANTTDTPVAASAANGVIVSVDASKNPLGTKTVAVSTTTERPVTGAEKAASKTVYGSDESTTDVNSSVTEVPPPTAFGGVMTSGRLSLTPGGRGNLTQSTKRELPVPGASVQMDVTPGIVETTVTDENVGSPFTVDGKGTFSHRVTPGGLISRTKSTATVTSGYILSHTKTGDAFSSTETKQTVETVKDFGITGLTNSGTEGSARIRTVQFSEHPKGYFIKTETIETVAAGIMIETSDTQTDGTHHTYQFISASNDRVKNLFLNVANKISGSLSFNVSVNKFNLCTGSMHFIEE